MERKKPQPKVDLPLQGNETFKPLKKHLKADSLSQPSHRGFMDDLKKRREDQDKEETSGNGSSQTKS